MGTFKPFILAFFIILSQVDSQETRTFFLLDEDSKEPVQFATIKAGQDYFTYSNEQGKFNLLSAKAFTVRHVSYKTQTFSLDSISSDTLLLEPSPLTLSTVVISGSQEKAEIGNLTKKDNYTINITRGMEIMLRFPKEKTPSTAQVLTMELPLFNHKDVDYHNIIIRPRFYLIDPQTNSPGEEIGRVNDTFTIVHGKQKLYTIDLSKYDIFLPDQGFFAGVEIIGSLNSEGLFNQNPPPYEKIDIRGSMKKKPDGYQTLIKINEGLWIDLKNQFQPLGSKVKSVNVSLGLKVIQ